MQFNELWIEGACNPIIVRTEKYFWYIYCYFIRGLFCPCKYLQLWERTCSRREYTAGSSSEFCRLHRSVLWDNPVPWQNLGAKGTRLGFYLSKIGSYRNINHEILAIFSCTMANMMSNFILVFLKTITQHTLFVLKTKTQHTTIWESRLPRAFLNMPMSLRLKNSAILSPSRIH